MVKVARKVDEEYDECRSRTFERILSWLAMEVEDAMIDD
jgi:hypothetical protein